jgi:hypothetical protein
MSSKVLLDKRARVGALALVLVMGTAGLVSGFR